MSDAPWDVSSLNPNPSLHLCLDCGNWKALGKLLHSRTLNRTKAKIQSQHLLALRQLCYPARTRKLFCIHFFIVVVYYENLQVIIYHEYYMQCKTTGKHSVFLLIVPTCLAAQPSSGPPLCPGQTNPRPYVAGTHS